MSYQWRLKGTLKSRIISITFTVVIAIILHRIFVHLFNRFWVALFREYWISTLLTFTLISGELFLRLYLRYPLRVYRSWTMVSLFKTFRVSRLKEFFWIFSLFECIGVSLLLLRLISIVLLTHHVTNRRLIVWWRIIISISIHIWFGGS